MLGDKDNLDFPIQFVFVWILFELFAEIITAFDKCIKTNKTTWTNSSKYLINAQILKTAPFNAQQKLAKSKSCTFYNEPKSVQHNGTSKSWKRTQKHNKCKQNRN